VPFSSGYAKLAFDNLELHILCALTSHVCDYKKHTWQARGVPELVACTFPAKEVELRVVSVNHHLRWRASHLISEEIGTTTTPLAIKANDNSGVVARIDKLSASSNTTHVRLVLSATAAYCTRKKTK
jgi:hypothetical protein